MKRINFKIFFSYNDYVGLINDSRPNHIRFVRLSSIQSDPSKSIDCHCNNNTLYHPKHQTLVNTSSFIASIHQSIVSRLHRVEYQYWILKLKRSKRALSCTLLRSRDLITPVVVRQQGKYLPASHLLPCPALLNTLQFWSPFIALFSTVSPFYLSIQPAILSYYDVPK